MENIFLGRIPYKKVAGIRWSDEKELYKEADAVLKKLDINLNPRTKVGTLSTSYCQLVEIARAVSIGAKVVIMDEPTSSLTEGETKILFRIIQQLKNDNVAIIYISHKMDEIMIRYQGVDHAFLDKVGDYPQAEDCAKEIAERFRRIVK